MANNCFNHIIFSEITSDNKEKLKAWLKTYSDFSYMNDWVNSIVPEEHQLTPNWDKGGDPYQYGGRWFEFGDVDSLYEDEDSLTIQGDSAWNPMLGMCKVLSKILDCSVNIEYEESGCDFSGYANYEKGNVTEKWAGTYLEGKYVMGDGLYAICDEATYIVDEYDETEIQIWMKDCKTFMSEKDYKELEDHVKERKEKKLNRQNQNV